MPRPEPALPPADKPNPAAQYDMLLPDELAEALRKARTRTGKPGWSSCIGEFEIPGEVRVYQGQDLKGIFVDVQGAVDFLNKASKTKKA